MNNSENEIFSIGANSFSEQDLYPILINYLRSEFKLYCQRINERRSQNSRGLGGNRVVASRYCSYAAN